MPEHDKDSREIERPAVIAARAVRHGVKMQPFAEPLHEQHGTGAFPEVDEERQDAAALAEAAEHIGEPGVAAAEIADIRML